MKELSIKKKRIASLDILRGLIIVVMTLDHTRDFFYAHYASPTDLSKASSFLFLTRWITHYCAPGFIFLAGTSLFLSASRKSSKAAMAEFLLKRGLWLIVIEIVIINLAWRFNPEYPRITLGVLWVIGICMILMAAIIYLPIEAIFVVSLIIIFGHNALDYISYANDSGLDRALWSILHEPMEFEFQYRIVKVLYPVLPWIGVMSLGYCFGQIFKSDFVPKYRLNILLIAGLASIALFFIMRGLHVYGTIGGYGDPMAYEAPMRTLSDGTQHTSAGYSFLQLLNCTKYPPSLHYVLMTLGPLLLLLWAIEKFNINIVFLQILGRVPFFYYIIHIFVIHGSARMIAAIGDYDHSFKGWNGLPADFGFGLPGLYISWILITVTLYIPCYFYNRYKSAHPENKLLSYL